MSVGFIMMVHDGLNRAALVARHWASHDCPVMVHVDRRVGPRAHRKFVAELAEFPHVRFSDRFRCEWGTWSLVAATKAAANQMLDEFPDVRHVYLASGACLPLRPVDELRDYLARHPDTDFIESVTIDEVPWSMGGFDHERFTLSFPFSWKRQRFLFDRWVALQRSLRLRRSVPDGLVPHLGSQWWCLTRDTLATMREADDRAAMERYFRRVWIPDESYFQTLVRRYGRKVESRSLTLSKFDFQGKPHIFYDDHLQLLRRSDCFVARKIWPQANRLYRSFLNEAVVEANRAEPNPGKIDTLFTRAVYRRTRGRPGLYMAGRFPKRDWENGLTAAPYSVLGGFGDLFEDFAPWLSRATGMRVHGHLFAPERAEFAEGQRSFAGALSDSAALRDYNPEAFLSNLIWNTRGERQAFLLGPRDSQRIRGFLTRDSNANISIISGAWAVRLFRTDRNPADLRAEAAQLQRIEAEHLSALRDTWTRARVRIWTLSEFIEAPMDVLQSITHEAGSQVPRRMTDAPRLVSLQGLGVFLQELRNQGTNPYLVGDIPSVIGEASRPEQPSRPYLVE